jgi:prepilin-type N-terminal cleavage/methylation domain-containing protein
MMRLSRRAAFSLVELSIVLVILGLIVGGILSGQSLIRAAEIRKVSSDVARYNAAINAFRDKYFTLPGDMPNAVRFWGAAAGGTTDGVDSTCAQIDNSSAVAGIPTCNGNGNGQVYQWSNVGLSGGNETFRAWQHLANAGLIEGQYTGVANAVFNTASSSAPRVGWNVPVSSIKNASFLLVFFGTNPNPGNSVLFDASYGHVLTFGSSTSYHGLGYGTAIKPEEAWNIDTKMDDGRPGTGSVLTTTSTANPNCADSSSTTANYQLAVTSNACGMIFKTGL